MRERTVRASDGRLLIEIGYGRYYYDPKSASRVDLNKYFLKGEWESEYTEVSKEQYIRAERQAGFYPSIPGEIATSAFSGNGVSGCVEYPKDLMRLSEEKI